MRSRKNRGFYEAGYFGYPNSRSLLRLPSVDGLGARDPKLKAESGMFTGHEIERTLRELGVTDVVWLPDSEIGQWESALESSPELSLIRVCREGEAWALAAGLQLGGRLPVVIVQNTGLYESSDSMRNVVFDLQIPVFAIIGARDWLNKNSNDSAKIFSEPLLKAWQINYCLIERERDKPQLAKHFQACRRTGQPGAILLAESSQ